MPKENSAVVRVWIQCSGRGFHGEAVLQEKVEAEAVLGKRRGDSRNVSCDVTCPHIAGAHGQRCKASHPGRDKVGSGVMCPYSFDYPYILEFDSDWRPPTELTTALKAIKSLLD